MTHTTLQVVLTLTAAAMSAGVAICGLAAAPRSRVHRVFAITMGCLALMQLGAGLSAQSMYGDHLRLLASAALPGVGLLFSLCFARFSPREHIHAWRWGLVVTFVAPFGLIGMIGPMLQRPLNGAGYGFYILTLGSAMAILAELEKTLRASAGSIRAQIKFVVLGLGCVFAARVYTASQMLLSGGWTVSLMAIEAMAVILANVLIMTALWRRRRLDVQLYVAQSLPLHAVSLKIAILSLLLASGLSPAGALWSGALLVLILVVLISDWVRYESRRFLNRYVFRTRYDYRRIWNRYTQGMAAIVDPRELCQVMSRLVSDTFGVPAVTVWLLEKPAEAQNRLVIGGSTVSWDRQTLPDSWETIVSTLMATMLPHTMPIDFASPLRRRQGVQDDASQVLQALRIRYGAVLISGKCSAICC